MEFKDYYQTMGLEKTASAEDIKRTYRKLARKYHPDVSKEPGAEAKFKEINEAYEVLKDPEKRKAYDQMGANWRGGQEFNPNDFDFSQFGFGAGHAGAGGFHGFQGGAGGDFSDFFESLFSGGGVGGGRAGGRRQRAARGEDSHVTMELSLEDAFSGITKTIQFSMAEATPDGRMKEVPKTLKVKIPAGVSNGRQIRLTGQGASGVHGGPAGDLYIKIHLKAHVLFRVHERDIQLDVPITPWEAALGTSIEVPTLVGSVTVKIPAGARSGQKLRLKDKGFKSKNETGAQFLILHIQTPPAETDEQKKFYAGMQQTFSTFNPRQAWKQ